MKHLERWTRLHQKITAVLTWNRLPLILIGLGILLRVVQYGANRSLWADEATLAINIANRSFSELLQPLDFQQAAPIGFLMTERLAVEVFGNNEYALRLFPLLAGIASLFCFYALAKCLMPVTVASLALLLFATSPPLIYYASEVKQYSSDVAIALLACLIVLRMQNQALSFTRIVAFGLAGAILIWFSHPAVFVLAGTGLSAIWYCLEKQPGKISRLLATYAVWAASFLAFYFLFLNRLGSRSDLVDSFKGHGAFPTSLLELTYWPLYKFGEFFVDPLGYPEALILFGIIAAVAGYISIAARSKQDLLFLLSPILVTFFAALIQKYPFHKRLVLFLTPFAILFIAEGIEYFRRKARPKALIFSMVLLGLLVAYPLASASSLLVQPDYRQEIRPVVAYVKQHQQPGDVLYIYQRGAYQFQYYAPKYGYQPGDYIIGVDDLDAEDGYGISANEARRYRADLDKLRGNPRVWLILSHTSHVREERRLVLAHLNRIGTKLDEFHRKGAFTVLYDLSRTQ